MDEEKKIVNNSMLYIQDCKKMLDKGFEDVSDIIKSVGGKQCFELCINETELNGEGQEVINKEEILRIAEAKEKELLEEINYLEKKEA